MIVCVCHGINERQVEAALNSGATTLDKLGAELGIGTCCGSCKETCSEMIAAHKCSTRPAKTIPIFALTPALA